MTPGPRPSPTVRHAFGAATALLSREVARKEETTTFTCPLKRGKPTPGTAVTQESASCSPPLGLPPRPLFWLYRASSLAAATERCTRPRARRQDRCRPQHPHRPPPPPPNRPPVSTQAVPADTVGWSYPGGLKRSTQHLGSGCSTAGRYAMRQREKYGRLSEADRVEIVIIPKRKLPRD